MARLSKKRVSGRFKMIKKFQNFLKEVYWRAWYSYISQNDKNNELTFLNYGFQGNKILDNLSEENNRYSIQLYDFVVGSIPGGIGGKNVLEIGSGRGGGALFLTKTHDPHSFIGMDLCEGAIDFCRVHYHDTKLSFLKGDAQKIPLKDNSQDIIINIESSHRYPDMNQFLREVNRTLKPKGYFSFTDFRASNKVDTLINNFFSSGMTSLKTEIITPQVLRALDLDNKRKLDLISRLVPKILHKPAREFASVKGSLSYESLAIRQREYLYLLMQKPERV